MGVTGGDGRCQTQEHFALEATADAPVTTASLLALRQSQKEGLAGVARCEGSQAGKFDFAAFMVIERFFRRNALHRIPSDC